MIARTKLGNKPFTMRWKTFRLFKEANYVDRKGSSLETA